MVTPYGYLSSGMLLNASTVARYRGSRLAPRGWQLRNCGRHACQVVACSGACPQHVQLQSGGPEEQARRMAAADDIRRLLHQFAAGFLKEPSQDVLAQLREILETEVDNTLSPPEEDDDLPLEREDAVTELPVAAVAEPEPEPIAEVAPTSPRSYRQGHGGPRMTV